MMLKFKWMIVLVLCFVPLTCFAAAPNEPSELDMILRNDIHARLKQEAQKAHQRRMQFSRPQFERYCREIREQLSTLLFNDTGWLDFRNEPVSSVIVGAPIEKEMYRIFRVAYESMPDRWATANLYLPRKVEFPVPAIVAVSDHAPGGKAAPYNQQQGIVFAMKGYVTLVIDAPDRGEQLGGNDHFVNGAQLALTGLWSNYFFVADALRAVDYLRSRTDWIDSERIGMTGTSGGGETSAVAAALDTRIKAVVPCCYIEPFHRAAKIAYTYCPEYFIPSAGPGPLDWADMMALTVPRPLAPLRAMQDSLFTNAGFDETVELGAYFYRLNGVPRHFQALRTDEPHTYSAAMRDLAFRWFARWLGSRRGETPPPIEDRVYEPNELQFTPPNEQLDMETEAALAVGIKSKITMQTLAARRAERYAKDRYAFSPEEFTPDRAREIRGRVKAFYHPRLSFENVDIIPKKSPDAQQGYIITSFALGRDDGMLLPAKLIEPARGPVRRVLFYLDENGEQGLEERGLRELAAGGTAIFTVDLRGMGRLYPRASDWDKYPWCDISRPLAYSSWTLGISIPHLQIEDALFALHCLRSREQFASLPVYIMGVGRAAPVALMTAAIDEDIRGIIGIESLVSYRDYVQKEMPQYNLMALSYAVLQQFDIPVVLASVADRLLLWANPVDADYTPVPPSRSNETFSLARSLCQKPERIISGQNAPEIRLLIQEALSNQSTQN